MIQHYTIWKLYSNNLILSFFKIQRSTKKEKNVSECWFCYEVLMLLHKISSRYLVKRVLFSQFGVATLDLAISVDLRMVKRRCVVMLDNPAIGFYA